MSGETLLRQWRMLHLIPREPQRRSTSEIAARLNQDSETAVHVRTVQRDLNELSRFFQYTSDTEGRTQYWYFPKTQRLMDLPAMDAGAALALLLTREHLRPLMPPSTMNLIGAYFHRAEEVLKDLGSAPLAAWRQRVCVMSRGPHLQPPKIDQGVLTCVYQAVLEGKQLTATYKARGANGAKQHLLNPLGIAVHDGVTYLAAVAKDYEDVVTYALHRMSAAQVLPTVARRPKGFALEDFARKTFRFPVSGQTIKLVLRIDAQAGQHLEERPLSSDQAVSRDGDVMEVRASVADTEDLRWWLLAMGEHVEVRGPVSLRTEMKRRLEAAHKAYR